MSRLASRLAARLDERNVVPVCAVLLAAAALGDFLTGVDLTFTLLYVFPIALGAWFRGRAFGVVLSLVAAASGAFTEIAASGHHHARLAVVWNQAGAAGIFVTITWLFDSLHRFVKEEHRQRGLALSQLRHAGRLHVVGTLAAGVAHELGTPLNVIGGYAQILGADDATPETRRAACQTILRQTTRMTETIRSLLDFSRRGGSGREVTDLGAIVDEVSLLLRATATRAGCLIERTGPRDTVMVSVNAREIEQVVTNLIVNATQAMPRGGVVRVGCERKAGGGRAGEVACIRVEDEGGGIAPADLPRIFDPFFTTKDVGEGTGLGLSVSYGIVHDHGGSIRVESELGRGSRFVVWLPVAAAPS
jgi:signal transduction histidine kinase